MLPETASALAFVPPWLVLAALLGVINGAASFMLIGRHPSGLAWYALLGIFAAGLGQVVGDALHLPVPLKIGDVNVLATSLGTWIVLIAARFGGL
ncbi:MAG TPA: hypothetical protein VFG86_24205 [Chloroflexota bacterium]|nr:hypothetical protein [Chloroflexota bacterium]